MYEIFICQIILVIVLVLIFVVLIYFYRQSLKSRGIYIKSPLDNREYLVQNFKNKEEATNMLSTINQRIFIFRDYLFKHMNEYPDYEPYIKQLCNRIQNVVLQENSPNGKYTSYTVNKGDQIALCLRSKKTQELHDINLIMYVVLHELAHVACPEIDHTELFKKIFIFFLQIAIMLKIYQNVDYQINPHEYCGIVIREKLLKN